MSAKALVSIYKENSSSWFRIGGDNADIRCPSEYSGISTTVVDSARNVQAQVIADIIASDVAKIEMSWNYLTVAEYSALAQLFEQKYNGSYFVPVAFFDIVKGDWDGTDGASPSASNNVRIFYCGDRKVSVAHITLDSTGKPIGYTGVKLNLIDTGRKYND